MFELFQYSQTLMELEKVFEYCPCCWKLLVLVTVLDH